ncbi:unnamed protein product [Lepeophtheirus salmonis]|uniref:(salmon louse) hypothetical protein n=1 Tax=Lepeophtheirus salmonis TaxID=72036 RepID=A0A7R8H416_LEPSM|nr:unnamed protein product [Lepeophtheirus salmonis]CAF2853887.1 unnamed protein product [Lepeophtheirus salmonis]
MVLRKRSDLQRKMCPNIKSGKNPKRVFESSEEEQKKRNRVLSSSEPAMKGTLAPLQGCCPLCEVRALVQAPLQLYNVWLCSSNGKEFTFCIAEESVNADKVAATKYPLELNDIKENGG